MAPAPPNVWPKLPRLNLPPANQSKSSARIIEPRPVSVKTPLGAPGTSLAMSRRSDCRKGNVVLIPKDLHTPYPATLVHGAPSGAVSFVTLYSILCSITSPTRSISEPCVTSVTLVTRGRAGRQSRSVGRRNRGTRRGRGIGGLSKTPVDWRGARHCVRTTGYTRHT